jgi:hypothetical protein
VTLLEVHEKVMQILKLEFINNKTPKGNRKCAFYQNIKLIFFMNFKGVIIYWNKFVRVHETSRNISVILATSNNKQRISTIIIVHCQYAYKRRIKIIDDTILITLFFVGDSCFSQTRQMIYREQYILCTTVQNNLE